MSSLISKVQSIMNMKKERAYAKYKFHPARGFSVHTANYETCQPTWEAIRGKRERSEMDDEIDLPPPTKVFKRKEHPFEDMDNDEPPLPTHSSLLDNEWCVLQDHLQSILKPRRRATLEVDLSTLVPYRQLQRRLLSYAIDNTDAKCSISSVIDHLAIVFPQFLKSLRHHKSKSTSPSQVLSNLRKLRLIIQFYDTENALPDALLELVHQETTLG